MTSLKTVVVVQALLQQLLFSTFFMLLFGLSLDLSWKTGIGTTASSLINSRSSSGSNSNNNGRFGSSSSSFHSSGFPSSSSADGSAPGSSLWDQPLIFAKPYFENSTKRDVITTVGQTAYLNCRVRNLGDRAVSWIRKRDLHILTVGVLTYTGDQRFQSLHSDGSDEWTLKISSAQMRDSGTYECQVSIEPKISLAFRLGVVVSQAEILGNSELHLKSGSDINLTCIVREIPEPPTYIYWYHGNKVINYSQRGGINVLTEKQTRTSRLLISKAQPNDSGNYTCSPSNSESASALVHILNGEHPAAMQHGNNHAVPSARIFNLFTRTKNLLLLMIGLLLLIVTIQHLMLIVCGITQISFSSTMHQRKRRNQRLGVFDSCCSSATR